MLTRCVLLVALLMCVAPTQPARAQGRAVRDQVVIGMSQEPDMLNPLFAQTPAAGAVHATIFTVDVQRDNNWKLFPQGVRALPNLGDGTWKVRGETMTLAWTLRPRAWHDGTPVTCGDYVFAFQAASDPGVRVGNRNLTNRIRKVDCPTGAGGTQVIVHWKELYPYAHTVVTSHGALPRHILERTFRQDPRRLRESQFGHNPSATVGDGAYRLVDWRKGRSLTVEAVPNHPIFGSPQIRRIVWRFIPDRHSLVESMRSGSIDAVSTIGITFDQAEELARLETRHVKVFFEPGATWEHIDFNLDNPLLQDVRVRRAIAFAINRRDIAQVFSWRQPISHSYLPPRRHAFNDATIKYPYSPDRARALLREAGWTIGADGILRNAAGKRFSIEIGTTAGNPARERIEQIIKQNLQDVGIELTVRSFPAKAYFGEQLGRRRFAALAMYAWKLSPTTGCNEIYTSEAVPSEDNGWIGHNYPGYKNAEMDNVCKSAASQVDEHKRDRLLAESARIFSRDLPALPLYTWATVAAAKPALANFKPVQLMGTFESWNAHTWFWTNDGR